MGNRLSMGLRAFAIFTVTLLVTSSWATTNWHARVLHDFNGSDGSAPQSGLIFDAAGNLYGTTQLGGIYTDGTVFELSPMPGGGWTETVLHNFNANGSDGWWPFAELVLDAAGNLYGTTVGGGTYDEGTVFELSPMQAGGWTETVLYSFGNGMDGAYPFYGALIFDAAGNLYGTTSSGGTHNCQGNGGCGTVFQLSPTAGGGWTETVLYTWDHDNFAWAGLIFDATGNLYGTTEYGGTHQCDGGNPGCGTVFELSPVHACIRCSRAGHQ